MPGIHLILFGATGLVGSGTLHVALADPDVERILVVGRSSTGRSHPKLKELLLPDLFDLSAGEADLTGYNACIFAIGVTAVGKSEADYSHLTYDLTLGCAQTLLRLNPSLSFAYVCGAGAESDRMWARVRRRLELALFALPFSSVTSLRPAGIQPMPGFKSRTPAYQFFIVLFGWLFPVMVRFVPGYFTTLERLARALLKAVKGEAGQQVLESIDINRVGAL